MAPTDKDRSLKQIAVSFCISQGLVPYLEVPVLEVSQLSSTPLLTTDIDVLGMSLEWTGRARRTMFDCKNSKEGPVNRAIWAAGLIGHLGLDEGYVILRRSSSPTHKLTAERRSVYLFDGESFERFASFYSSSALRFKSYLSDFTRHDEIIKFFGENNPLYKAYHEIVHITPLQRDSGLGIRRIVSQLTAIQRELDPNKRAHQYIIVEALAALSIFMFEFLSKVVRLLNAKSDEKEFERIAKLLIWGGAQAFEEKQKLRELAFPEAVAAEPQFPAWSEFVRMATTLLVALGPMSSLPLLLRTLASRTVKGVDEECEDAIREQMLSTPRVRQIVFSMLRFLKKATGMPTEFVDLIEAEINVLVAEKKPSPQLIGHTNLQQSLKFSG